MLLYHYRPYQTAMIELEKQTLYFADYQDLNDPMEGYLNVVWPGDEIAWKGLMRNYVCILDNVLSLYLLKANRDELQAFLRLVHFRALNLCIRSGVERHTMPKEELSVAEGFEQKNLLADISEQEYWNIRKFILKNLKS